MAPVVGGLAAIRRSHPHCVGPLLRGSRRYPHRSRDVAPAPYSRSPRHNPREHSWLDKLKGDV